MPRREIKTWGSEKKNESTSDWILVYDINKCISYTGLPGGSDGKESTYNAGDPGLIPGSGRSPREGWQPTPVFLPGESHGQRSLVGHSLWGHKELDTTEQLTHKQINISM